MIWVQNDIIVTLFSVTCVLFLLLSETYYFFGEQRMDTIIVDHSMSTPFPIFMDIIFPFLDCSLVTVDLVDDQEHPIPVLAHDIRKHRINLSGQELSAAQTRAAAENKQQANGVGKKGGEVQDLGKGLGAVQKDCMPCNDGGFTFGGEQCCDCNAVKEYYRKREEPETFTSHPLCIRDHSKSLLAVTKEGGASLALAEGCRIRGHVTVPRVKANLHVAANVQSLRAAKSGGIQGLSDLNDKFRVQHVIKALRFGEEFDGQASPLAGVELYNPGLLRHIYLIKLVPTRYEGSWIPIESYQYSFAPHTEKIDTSKPHWHFPGIYFRYEFTPMMALISTRYSHLSTYITRVFALIGGLWVVLGVIYRMSHKVVAQVSNKKSQ